MGRRMKVYSVQMALRVACFFGFVFIDNVWWRIACVVGMVFLPWSAVLLANAGADKSERGSSYLGPDLQPELTAASGGPASESDDDATDSDDPARDRGEAQDPSTDESSPRPSGDLGPDVVEGEWSADPSSDRDR
ncbi:DUF3099 domain-containing protein [Kocuria coralli]|uniref:DUF3099 domain-containing protein n=2 Tax=Kocuria coralli TaxID=1461025 RepID=A0A5J5L0I1_9MICC|nr:DUF3099 domain-containing protein [Kocuria coralli]